MNTVTAVKNRILQLCGERDISINKLATISALPPSSIKNILYGKSQNPKLITIKMICDGLGITLGTFSPHRSLTGWRRRSNRRMLIESRQQSDKLFTVQSNAFPQGKALIIRC